MNYTELFWSAWDRLFAALPHHRQVLVLANPGGFEWRQLAGAAALEAEQ
ncbi:MAG: hypothetical protein IPK15_27380 [Verrucomicrobia bacterium]|nr:hypothetical protein [Verrucomicrobiota bacterium]